MYVLSITATSTQVITGITQADPAVVTSTAHGFKSGDAITFAGVAGMTELNDNVHYAKKLSANTFSVHNSSGTGIDSSGFSASL